MTEAVTAHITTYKIQTACVSRTNRQRTGYRLPRSNTLEVRRRLESTISRWRLPLLFPSLTREGARALAIGISSEMTTQRRMNRSVSNRAPLRLDEPRVERRWSGINIKRFFRFSARLGHRISECQPTCRDLSTELPKQPGIDRLQLSVATPMKCADGFTSSWIKSRYVLGQTAFQISR
jgi:hypothetical protein